MILKTSTAAFIVIGTLALAPGERAGAAELGSASEILEAAGTSGGLVVHLGCGDGRLTAELAAGDAYLVHGLDLDPGNVERARRNVRSAGLYGKVSISAFDGRRLPYTDNLVNLLVASEPGDVSAAEIMRVLAPGGVVISKKGTGPISRNGPEGAAQKLDSSPFSTTVKPWPEEIDEWTHFLHGADGNPVAMDTVVGPPERYQWLAGPTWLRSHESDSSVKTLVSSGGRIFYIVDEGPTSLLGENPLPDKWSLAARDAFNGVELWKVPIEDWGWRAWKPSWFTPRPGDIPLNVQKRLVAVGDKVYVTLGYRAPVSQLDAATGRVLQTYKGTERAAEILLQDGVLILTVLDGDRAVVTAVDTQSGKQLWTSEHDYGGTTTDYYRFSTGLGSVKSPKIEPTLNTATDGRVVALLDGEDVVGLDFNTGRQTWRTTFPLVEADFTAGKIDAGRTVWTGTLIVRDGVVVHASPNQLAAFSADSGRMLWKQPKKYIGHLWYEWKDVFVIDRLVWTWSAELDNTPLETGGRPAKGSVVWPVSVKGYDLQSGQLVKEVSLGNVFKTYHHHRCYRNKATPRFIMASRRGTEFIDLAEGDHTVHNWVRGTCHLGMMPANGLQYAPPHPCQCYIDEKLNGFNALASGEGDGESGREGDGESGGERLERGPAYTTLIPNPQPLIPPNYSWPCFRGDALRSGSVATELDSSPSLVWKAKVDAGPAAPVSADGRLFVPVVDKHQLVAFNAKDGRRIWDYSVGGRIDSPPTCYGQTVLFGSADGWVYCLRADDGRLVWRFRAAPYERLIGAFGQLESAWPVHGSVLLLDGVVYFAAGRSSQLDGGIYLYGLDAGSGEIRHQARLQGPDYRAEDISQNYHLPMGSLSDIMQSDGQLIYMRGLTFDAGLEQVENPPRPITRRIQAPSGMLDDSYFKRVPWTFGLKGGYARLLVHDNRQVFGARMFDSLQGLNPNVYFVPGAKGYLLFASDVRAGRNNWSQRIPVRVRAMVAAQDVLFVAGPPDVVDPLDPLGAFEGRKGGVLMSVDTADGKTLWETTLPDPPVFNGMAAARRRLYVTTTAGEILCFGEND